MKNPNKLTAFVAAVAAVMSLTVAPMAANAFAPSVPNPCTGAFTGIATVAVTNVGQADAQLPAGSWLGVCVTVTTNPGTPVTVTAGGSTVTLPVPFINGAYHTYAVFRVRGPVHVSVTR